MLRGATIISLTAIILLASVDADAGRRRGRKGALDLECSVDGAKVWVDGKMVGTAPISQQALGVGSHTIKISKLGYIEHSQRIVIREGKTVRVSADLLPKSGVIKVTANVLGARLFVDGTEVGKTPLELEVKPGRRTVIVRAAGHPDYQKIIKSVPGNTTDIFAKFRGGNSTPVAVASADPLDDDLALTPLTPPSIASSAAKTRDGGGADDDLENDAPDDDLMLAPLTQGPDLELTAMTPLLLPSDVTAVDANLGGGIGTTVEPATPWYFEWWAISGAAAVVVTAVVIGTVTAVNQEGGTAPTADIRWRPGDKVEQNVPY